jgi:hypothetical protein
LPVTSWANPALAQSHPAPPDSDLTVLSGELVDFLVKNAPPDEDDFSVSLSSPKLPFQAQALNYPLFSLGKFGKLVMQAKSDIDLPEQLRLSGNTTSMTATASLQHQIEGETLPPHFKISLKGEASDTDFLSSEQGNLASAELTFEGLLLKGVPEFLSKTEVMQELTQPEPEGLGLKLETDRNKDSWAKISKTIKFPQGVALERLKTLEKTLKGTLSAQKDETQKVRAQISGLKSALEQARQNGGAAADIQQLEETLRVSEKQIANLQDDLKDYLAEKLPLLSSTSLLVQEFRCAPEFFREVKFPIWEKRASQSTSSPGQSASAEAAVGVSGDVVIDISKPTCRVAIVPPFRGEASTFFDVSVTSSGYFGARADAQTSKEIAVVFKHRKDGTEYPLVYPKLSDDEKKTLNKLVLKTVDDVKNSESVINAMQAKIDSEFVQPLVTSIETALIGTDTAPASAAKICSLFNQLGLRTPGFEEELVCQALESAKPIHPELQPPPVLNLPPELTLPTPPGGVCVPEAPLPPCRVEKRTVQPPDVPCPGTCERNVSYPCPTWSNPGKTCTRAVPYPCTKKCRPPAKTVEVEIPPGCRQAQQITERTNGEIRLTCSRIRQWEEQRNSMIRDWENKRAVVRAKYEQDFKQWQENVKRPYDEKLARWQEDSNRWEKNRDPARIRNLATKTVRERILLSSVNSRAIAQKLLDFAWKVEEGARDTNDQIELVSDFVQKYALDRISLSVKGSARAAFESKSYPLETRPTFKFVSDLKFNSGEPSLNLVGSAYRNGPGGSKGQVGGLSAIGLELTAEQAAYLGGQKIGEVKGLKPWNFLVKPLGGERLSNKEEVVFQDSVPLKIKAN